MGTFSESNFIQTIMSYTIVYRKYMVNPLLNRKQMIIDVKHPSIANISKIDLRKKISLEQKVQNSNCISLFGFRTHFGGGKSTGFCLIYDNEEALKKYEPKFRLRRIGLYPEGVSSSKAKKEKKNKMKKLRGK